MGLYELVQANANATDCIVINMNGRMLLRISLDCNPCTLQMGFSKAEAEAALRETGSFEGAMEVLDVPLFVACDALLHDARRVAECFVDSFCSKEVKHERKHENRCPEMKRSDSRLGKVYTREVHLRSRTCSQNQVRLGLRAGQVVITVGRTIRKQIQDTEATRQGMPRGLKGQDVKHCKTIKIQQTVQPLRFSPVGSEEGPQQGLCLSWALWARGRALGTRRLGSKDGARGPTREVEGEVQAIHRGESRQSECTPRGKVWKINVESWCGGCEYR